MKRVEQSAQIDIEVGKMMKGLRKIGLGLVAVGLCLVLSLTSAIPVCEGWPDERVVKIGIRATYSGPLASTTVWAHNGQIDFVKHINERGGINGIRVQVLWEDNASAWVKDLTIHRRFKEARVLIETSAFMNSTEVIAQYKETPQVYMAAHTREMVTKPPWVASAMPGFGSMWACTMEWVKENWTEERPPRFGVIGIDSASGWDAIEGTKRGAAELGVEFVGSEIVPIFGVIDTSVEWLRLAGKKPDWIFVSSYGAVMVVLIKDASRLGIQKKGIKLAGDAAAIDEIVLRTAGEKASESWYSPRPQPCIQAEAGLPGLNTILEAAERYRGLEADEVPGHYAIGWIEAQTKCEAIRLAIEKVGFENLTPSAVRDGLFSIRDFDVGIVPPITITEERPYLLNRLRICQIQRGIITPYSKWLEPAFYFELE